VKIITRLAVLNSEAGDNSDERFLADLFHKTKAGPIANRPLDMLQPSPKKDAVLRQNKVNYPLTATFSE
jgi:hypothetical protein